MRDGRVTQSRVWQPLPEAESEEVSRRKERMYVQGQHRCQVHCDFPSECLHSVHTAWVEGRIQPAAKRKRLSRQSLDDSQPRPKKKKKKDLLPPERTNGVRRSSRLRHSESSDPRV